MSERTTQRLLLQVLRNQYRQASVLSALLRAPGVTAHPEPGVSLHDAMREVQTETLALLAEHGYGD